MLLILNMQLAQIDAIIAKFLSLYVPGYNRLQTTLDNSGECTTSQTQ